MQINGFTLTETPVKERLGTPFINTPFRAERDGLVLYFYTVEEAQIVIPRMDSGEYDGEVKAHHERTWDLPASRELS